MASPGRDYYCPPEAETRLDALVSRIEASPGETIGAREFAQHDQTIDTLRLVSSLPAGLDAEDLAGILHLALLTECATESYATAICERAETFRAGWLSRFIDNVWTPDELTHHAPYKNILMKIGYAESELDRQIKETQEREFVHYGGDTPVHVTTFGMVQEYLTDHWHGLIANLLRESAPHAAYMVTRVKRRETLHTAWYRDMTALQIEAQPRYVVYLAEEVSRFRMPGNSIVPALQSQANRWLPLMGADMDRVIRDVIRLLNQTLSNPGLLGRTLLSVAGDKGMSIGPLSARAIDTALNRLGGPGYGLVGEAVLEMAGLTYAFKSGAPAADSRHSLLDVSTSTARMRGLMRSWLAREMAGRLSLGAIALR